ncbi:MAG: DUF6644 family protein [Sphingomonas bacterium]
MSIATFGDWLYATPFSTAIRETTWIIPNVQTIHILAIAVVIGSALATELRFAGVFATDRQPADMLHRYLPWMRRALLVLLLTGLILVVAEPGRTLGNFIFWTKMALVAGASLVTLQARKPLLRESVTPEGGAVVEASRPLAWLMVLIWCAIIFCGRFIAYT